MGDLRGDDRAEPGSAGVLDRADLDVADPFPGALDAAVRVRQVGAVGQLQVHVRRVRDDGEAEVAHRPARPDREEAVGRVERLDGIGKAGQDGRPERTGGVRDRGLLLGQVAVERQRVRRLPGAHRMTRLTSLPPPATTIRSGARPSRIVADPLTREHRRLDVGGRGVGRDGDLVAQLAVDLDRDLAGRLDDRARVDLGPGLRRGSTSTAGRPRPARRLHSSSLMCGAAGASISSSRRIASSHSGVPATAVPR